MAAELRVYRARIRGAQSTQKITKAMELIATSRIAKAQSRMRAARPYAETMTKALAALGRNASLQHPMLTGVENSRRAGILVITSDRGLAGGYNVNAQRTANQLAERLRGEGKEPVRYVIGRKGVGYYRFRHVEIAGSWTGFSEQPAFADIREATEKLGNALAATSDGESDGQPGLDELWVVYTQFHSMISQSATAVQVSPVDVPEDEDSEQSSDGPKSAYDFEPEPDRLLATLLPRYISARIFSALLESATAESAARRQAMQSASDNAGELIKTFTRLANQARQAEITQEISEIVGGAEALATAGSD